MKIKRKNIKRNWEQKEVEKERTNWKERRNNNKKKKQRKSRKWEKLKKNKEN